MNNQNKNATRKLFVFDTEAPWIRSLLHAMPPEVEIHGFRIRNAFYFPGGFQAQLRKVGRCDKISEMWDDTWVSIPGWHKAFRISTWMVKKQIEKAIQRYGQPDVMLFNLPWYAEVAESFPGVTKAYYAYDPYRFYTWNSKRVEALEKRLLDNCNVGFAVARLLMKDLQLMTKTPVHYLPNATGWHFGNNYQAGTTEAERDFKSISKPRVGCVGQINSDAYDWDLIENVSEQCAEMHFVFIGPRFEESSKAAMDRIDRLFSRSNVHWLGPKPHDHLPAYLHQCQVLLNPLKVNDHNDRRSLLRLYDYLTTDRPIVSTAIAEASNHLPHISVAKDAAKMGGLLQDALNIVATSNLEQRRKYVAANSWEARAKDFWNHANRGAAAQTSKADDTLS